MDSTRRSGRTRGAGRISLSRGDRLLRGLGCRRAHFLRWWCAATGSGSAGKAGGEGGSWLRPRVLQPPGRSLAVSRRGRGKGHPPRLLPVARATPVVACRGGTGLPVLPVRLSTGADCTQCVLTASRRRVGVSHVPKKSGRQGSAAMSVTHPSRLETRTKKSNTCASQGAQRNPTAQ